MKNFLLLLCCLGIAYSLECVNCGVFLTAETPECRGTPTNTSCDPENIGCLTITGKNLDGTYYVEKRCATPAEQRKEGCKSFQIRGINAEQCFCVGDLCNHSGISFSGFLVIFVGLSLHLF